MCYAFFFFKQKTAYEMRISDWSSDVCSSDLLGRVGIGEGHRQADAIGGLRQRVAVAEYDDVGVMGAVHRVGAQFRPDAGRFARDQREPGAHRSAAAAARGSRCTDVDVGFAAHLAQDAVPLVFQLRSEEHTSELQSLMRISYA